MQARQCVTSTMSHLTISLQIRLAHVVCSVSGALLNLKLMKIFVWDAALF